MTTRIASPPAAFSVSDVQRLPGLLSRYRDPSVAKSLSEIAFTFAPFAALWAAMWGLMHISYGLALALAIPAAAFQVRLFMIQHDCGHGAFFKTRAANDWVGRAVGILTFTPYDYWKRTHAAHHATAGNLDRRGIGDIDTMTVDEYLGSSPLRRFGYRLYRHPLVMFGVGPAYLFLVQHRIPTGLMREGWKPWLSAMSTTAGAALVVALLMWAIGVKAFVMIHAPIFLIAGSIGVWMFFVQHQFDGARWAREGDWNLPEAALHGASHYDLPPVLRWLTGNIGIHHVHHLASRIPFYRLNEVLRDHPELAPIGRVTVRESLGCVKYALWDERAQKLISFAALRRRGREGAAG